MDQSRARGLAQPVEAVREEGIHQQAENGILRFGQLLDDSDAIDDDVWPNPRKRFDEGVVAQNINADERPGLVEDAEAGVRPSRPA
jgi:hypothetical protein